MHRHAPATLQHDPVGLPGSLTTMGIASAAVLFYTATSDRRAFAAALTKEQRDKLTPDDIIALMKKGNERFRLGQDSPHDYLAQQKASASGQYPAPIILSCIDSRAPAKTIMDGAIGAAPDAGVGGNVANEDIVASVEFACKVGGARVVLVMGHASAGAIKGGIDQAQLGNLTGLLAKIRPAVEATRYSGERSAKNYGFVDAVARTNVELTMRDIRRRSAILADLETSGAVKVAGAMYNIQTSLAALF